MRLAAYPLVTLLLLPAGVPASAAAPAKSGSERRCGWLINETPATGTCWIATRSGR